MAQRKSVWMAKRTLFPVNTSMKLESTFLTIVD
jgi:hypothetical protein